MESSLLQTAEDFYRCAVFYPVVDLVISEMDRRFADDNASALVKGMAACHPSSDNFLDYVLIKPLADVYNLDDDGMLKYQDEIYLMSLQQMSFSCMRRIRTYVRSTVTPHSYVCAEYGDAAFVRMCGVR